MTQYRYDASGRLVTLTYPSGRRIRLTYTAGQVTQISANGSPLLRDIQYQPCGPGAGLGVGEWHGVPADSSTWMAG